MNDIFWRLFTELNPFGSSGVGTSWYFIWIDIAVVTVVLYLLWGAVRGTRAIQIIQGIIVLMIVLLLISTASPFMTLDWIVTTLLQPALVVAIPVVFQPELRRLLESVGQNERFNDLWTQIREWGKDKTDTADGRPEMIRAIAGAAVKMSTGGTGALIVFERNVGLQDYLRDNVCILDARVTSDLIQQIFYPSSPLHDMAVIIRGDRILAARVELPLSQDIGGVKRFGTRHRAARGITEQSDAVALVVSEETGTISLFYNREMTSNLSEESIVILLTTLLHVEDKKTTVNA